MQIYSFVASPKKYIESEICNDEIHYAKNAKKTIIPLMFERLNEHDLKGIGLIITKLLRINVYKDPNEAHSWSGEISEQLIKAITESFNVTRNGCVEVSSNVENKSLEYANGDRYEGDLRNGLRYGKGVFFGANGDRYEGAFVNDKKHGKGIFYGGNGDCYEGDFFDDKRHGRGVFRGANGDKYDGGFINDRKHGKGVFHGGNGDKYEGDYNDDKKHGNGKFHGANGDIFVGNFGNDFPSYR